MTKVGITSQKYILTVEYLRWYDKRNLPIIRKRIKTNICVKATEQTLLLYSLEWQKQNSRFSFIPRGTECKNTTLWLASRTSICVRISIYFTQSGWKNDTTAPGDCTKPCKMFTKLTIRACLYTIYNNRLSDLCRSISNNRESIYTVEKKFTIHSSHTYIYTYCSHTYQNRYRYIGTYNFSSTQLNWNRYRYIVST